MPDAHVYLGGLSLRSGVQGEGVLKSISYGGESYTFTQGDAVAPTTENATGGYSRQALNHGVRFRFTTKPLTEGAVQGDPVKWMVKVDGKNTYIVSQGAGTEDTYKYTGADPGTTAQVSVYKNGELLKTYTVH